MATSSTRTSLVCNCGPSTNHLNIPPDRCYRNALAAFNDLHHLAEEADLSLHLPLYNMRTNSQGSQRVGFSAEILKSNLNTKVEEIFNRSQETDCHGYRVSFERSAYTTMIYLSPILEEKA